MALWNLGSINVDHVYDLPHIPRSGETLASTGLNTGLGGKGANMSVAAARAAARVNHIGAVGPDGLWAAERLLEYGVDTRHIARVDVPTGHAIILVDALGENSIVLFHGANHAIPRDTIRAALAEAATGDRVVIQNETTQQVETARLAQQMGLRVAYAAAPFNAEAVQNVLPYIDFLILNEVEAQQLHDATGQHPQELSVDTVIVTLGARGCEHFDRIAGTRQVYPSMKVDPIDTTGAGDTFTGYVLAGLDRGMPIGQAIPMATRAAALMVMRHGTADVIPDLSEVQAFR